MTTQEWQYDTAQDLNEGVVERLRRCPREPDMLVYGIRWAAAFMIRASLHLFHRVEVIGREHLPVEGSYVLIANHTSHLDTLCLLSVLPLKRLHCAFPAAAADWFFTSLSRTAVAATVVNALPFDRGVHFRQSLNLCKELLARPGTILIFFPEGTRSITGEIGEFKPGIGVLLAGMDFPLLPCHIAGAFEAWPKGRLLPRPGLVRLVIGAPRSYANLAPGRESAQHICRELRQDVLELAATHRRQ